MNYNDSSENSEEDDIIHPVKADYVLVAFTRKTMPRFYFGLIECVNDATVDCEAKFLKKAKLIL